MNYRLFRRAKVVNAVTLIELLVVISIIGVLAALLLRGVQAARESSRMTQCGNDLRQISLGLAQFEIAKHAFPHNGGWNGTQTIPDINGNPFTPATITDQRNNYGVGDPIFSKEEQTGSWLFSVLPFIEQQQIYERRDWEAGVDQYICASRRDATPQVAVQTDHYATYLSGGHKWGRTDYAGNLNCFPGLRQVFPKQNVSSRDITDGLSQSLLIGEKSYDPIRQGLSWYWDEPFFLGGSGGTVRWEADLSMDGPKAEIRRNWGSAHPGGVNVAFADGSVRSLSRSMDPEILAATLTIDNEDSVHLD